MKMLRGIGEFGLIERIAQKIKTNKSVICGVGDDTAVISYTKDRYLLFSTDMLIEGVHFTPKEATFPQIGRKALAINISDIAAMGGIPKYAVISAGLPKELCLRAVDDIMRGINTLACEYGINIVGGDTVRSSKIVLCVSLIGEVKKSNLTLRSGAKIGDLIFVTGSLGASRRLKQFNFIPRVREAQEIIKKFRPTAMIDLSDGLASDLQRIAQASKVGALIFEQIIPVSRGASLQSALYEGEDFELLFTLSLDSARKFYKKGKFPITCIGKIVGKKRGLNIIDKRAKVSPLKQRGFKHFR
ncbi:MAG: thiamine-monophosphate kinase [Candidatus Omnitrophica bacterium]|nr:thiamine-monophosphate kinase [Candidatus Omnitrophota bacterium]